MLPLGSVWEMSYIININILEWEVFTLNFRKATRQDIKAMMHLRKSQLVDEGLEADIDIDEELYHFFEKQLSGGSLIQYLVEEDEEVVACGAFIIYPFPPSFTNRSGKRAYITNMYTNKDYRGKGIATKLLKLLVEEAKEAGIKKLWLGASEMGRPVYKKFGFIETDEYMELNI